MGVRSRLLAIAMLVAGPACAAASDQQLAQNAANWDVFLKFYPKRALAAKEEGAVGFTVTLDNKGDVTNCQVTHSSGHPLLDQETCNVVTLHAQFKPDPSGGLSQVNSHEGVIVWKLPSSSTTLVAPKPVRSGSASEPVVCKKFAKIGSLVATERVCMTPSEWAKQADQMKQPWDELQGKKGSTSGN